MMVELFDAHFHIIDPEFPLYPNNGYLPTAFTVDDYLESTKKYHVTGGAIVSGSFQKFDQKYLIAALKKLGPKFVGVTNLPATTSDNDIITLSNHNIRAVRFNVYRGGSENINTIVNFAQRIYDLCNMHVELYIDGNQLNKYFDTLSTLPKVSIDHLGLTSDGLPSLFKLVEKGVFVKATGFMRVDFDVLSTLKTIYKINPKALLFGTDLPGTRASRIFNNNDISLIQENFTEPEQGRIFHKNALEFYRCNLS